jgi:predicted DNA-binding transcriptional regulator AlpA
VTQTSPTPLVDQVRRCQRAVRRRELRKIVPLADTTIYDMERRGEFPQRFYLTSKCVVWDLDEVERWLTARRVAGPAGRGAGTGQFVTSTGSGLASALTPCFLASFACSETHRLRALTIRHARPPQLGDTLPE